MSPKHLLLGQMLRPSDFGPFGLANQDFLFSHALHGHMMGIPGLTGSPFFDLGVSPPISFGAMNPYGFGDPMDRILRGGTHRGLLMPQMSPFYSPVIPSLGRYSNWPGGGRYQPSYYGAPTIPGLPGSYRGPRWAPYQVGPRYRPVGQAAPRAPKALAAKPLTVEERVVLKSFGKDLAAVAEASRKKDWTELDAAIRKVTAVPDLPGALSTDLKELDAAAKEIAASQWLGNALKLCAGLEREYVRKNQQGIAKLGIAARVETLVGPERADHVECRAFDLQVKAADIERMQKLVARFAEDLPPKKKSDATAAAVEKLLGRSLSGVETLVWLHIRRFQPGFLVLSAGFDFMDTDPAPLAGGAFQVGVTGLDEVARMAAALALPTVIIQEGGYDVERLGGYVVRFLTEFERATFEN